jgi:hypothetical protein
MRLVWNSFLSPPSSDRVKEPFQPLFFLLYPKCLWDGCDRIEAFDIRIRERKAVCPAGKTSTNCSKLSEEKSGKVTYRFEFAASVITVCIELAAFRATKPTARLQWELTTRRYSSAESSSRAKNFNFECTNATRLRALLVS